MTHKLITKIKNRPNLYYFDTAINNGKKITVKYCLFTEDEYLAMILAKKIKDEVNKRLLSVLDNYRDVKYFNKVSFKAIIKNSIKEQQSTRIKLKKNKEYLKASEYREIFENILKGFYASCNNKQNLNKDNIDQSIVYNKLYTIDQKQNYSYKEIATRYTRTECEKLKSGSRTKRYYIKTGALLDLFFDSKSISEIAYKDCEDFQLYLANSRKLNKKTVNNYTCYSSRIFDYAIKMDLIASNPFKLLTPFKISKEERSPKDNFTMQELKLIMNTDRQDLKDYMMFALHTGLRISEIWDLDASSVESKDNIKYIKVKTAKQKGGVIKYREIPLHKNIEYLSSMNWLEEIKFGKNGCDYFGKRLNRHIHGLLPNSNVSFHRLRGNFAKCIKDYCLENGISDLTSTLLGHSTDLSTFVYAKEISLVAKVKAMNGLNAFKSLF